MKPIANFEEAFLGNLEPLLSSKHEKQPEKRQVSNRWLVSAFVVGITSLVLMGGALFAALDGRELLTDTAKLFNRGEGNSDTASKGNHPGLNTKLRSRKSDVMMVSTLIRENGRNVVRQKPFLNVNTALTAAPGEIPTYPKFDALRVFSDSGNDQIVAKSDANIYGADVEGEIGLEFSPFPYESINGKMRSLQNEAEIIRQVEAAANSLGTGGEYVSALSYFDPERFAQNQGILPTADDFTITAENVSILLKNNPTSYSGDRYEERVIDVRATATISAILQQNGIPLGESLTIQNFLESDLGAETVRIGDRLHTWISHKESSEQINTATIARISVFRGKTHLVSIARTDDESIVYSSAPRTAEELLASAPEEDVVDNVNLPTAYDAIYRAALSKGLSTELSSSLIRIFAFDVDFKNRVSAEDSIEMFLSLEEGEVRPTAASEILYAAINIGTLKRRYYRYRDPETGLVDYYDETGKSAKKFLLRQPVPNGKFRSPFGMRRHPISRVYKLHGGVDWAAPRGTPIIASGNGTVTKASWAGGYGKQIIIKHANGYETSYSHMTRYGKGVGEGRRVRQGQVIGFVGSTGYSTGPHLHYEVKVNGRRVDPMRIRLPKGRVLKGSELITFETERDRIDSLLDRRDQNQQLASN